jgi:hypothetical protein
MGVRAQFEEYPTTGHYSRMDGSAKTLFLEPHPPLSIVLIGSMYLLTAASALPVLLRSFPVVVLGEVVQGPAAKAVYLLSEIAALYAGLGLLKLKSPARVLAIALSVLHMLNSALFVLRPGLGDRMIKLLEGTGVKFPPEFAIQKLVEVMMPVLYVGLVAGLTFSGVIVWILVTRKDRFTAAAAVRG